MVGRMRCKRNLRLLFALVLLVAFLLANIVPTRIADPAAFAGTLKRIVPANAPLDADGLVELVGTQEITCRDWPTAISVTHPNPFDNIGSLLMGRPMPTHTTLIDWRGIGINTLTALLAIVCYLVLPKSIASLRRGRRKMPD